MLATFLNDKCLRKEKFRRLAFFSLVLAMCFDEKKSFSYFLTTPMIQSCNGPDLNDRPFFRVFQFNPNSIKSSHIFFSIKSSIQFEKTKFFLLVLAGNIFQG